jgi:hypothetical protein
MNFRAIAGVLLVPLALAWQFPASAEEPVSFKKQVQPILNTRCVVCHVTGAESGGLNLQRASSLTNLVESPSTQAPLPRVTPGDPEKSYLVHKLRGTHAQVGGSGAAMPFTDGNPIPLPPADLQLIERWISEGAKDG